MFYLILSQPLLGRDVDQILRKRENMQIILNNGYENNWNHKTCENVLQTLLSSKVQYPKMYPLLQFK